METTDKIKGTAAQRYSELSSSRAPFLDRARLISTLTIPSLVPPDGFSGSTNLPQPYQSIGSRGVKNLAGRMIKTLYPPNLPYVRRELDPKAEAFIDELIKSGQRNPDEKTNLKKLLNDSEKALVTRFEQSNRRATLTEVALQLVVAGNSLVQYNDNGNVRMFSLANYVVKRDSYGDMLDLVIKETIARISLPADVISYCFDTSNEADSAAGSAADGLRGLSEEFDRIEKLNSQKDVEVYTRVMLNEKGTHFKMYQEINGIIVPDSEETFRKEVCPFMPLRFYPSAQGQDYSRSYVEEYLGDLTTFESNSKAMTLATDLMSRMVMLVEPGATISVSDLTKAKNGGFVKGSIKDVNALTFGSKSSDFSVSFQQNQSVQSRLEYAFLLNSALQRSGDRVTATEVQIMAQELEESLGGIYSIMSNELVGRLVALDLDYFDRQGIEDPVFKKVARPIPITGIAAFARDAEAQRLVAFTQAVTGAGAGNALNQDEIASRLAIAMGIDKTNLIKTPEQMQAERAEQMVQQNAGELIKQGGAIAQQGVPVEADPSAQEAPPAPQA